MMKKTNNHNKWKQQQQNDDIQLIEYQPAIFNRKH